MHGQGEARVLRLLWGLAPLSARGPRARSSLGDVARAAVSLADASGLAGVSLAAVAGRLGLTTTALYRYIDSKDTLVELMADTAVGPAPQLGDDEWPRSVHAWARALWQRYRAHPWLGDVLVAGMPRYPQRLAWMDVLLRELDRGPVADPLRTALLLDGVARTFGLLARASAEAPADPPTWLLEAVAARHPRLARELGRDWTDVEDELSRAVDTVLRGSSGAVQQP